MTNDELETNLKIFADAINKKERERIIKIISLNHRIRQTVQFI